MGHEILYELLSPDPAVRESASFVVGPGPEFVTGVRAGQAILDLDQSSIVIGPFLGAFSDLVKLLIIDQAFRFSDATGDLPDIVSVSLSSRTTVSLISPDDLDFTVDSIELRLPLVGVGFGEIIVLDAVFVPEPSSFPLFASGLAILAAGAHSRPTRRCS